MTTITSAANARVKEWASLKQKKYRDKAGRFLIEGYKLVEEAFKAGFPLADLVCLEGDALAERFADQAQSQGVTAWTLSESVFRHVADTESPQGVMAIGFMPPQADRMQWLEADGTCSDGLCLVIDAVRDPGNVGTMIRTADAVGATGVIVCDGCADLYQPKVVRATMGSLFHLPIIAMDGVEAVRQLKRAGFTTYAAVLNAPIVFDVERMAGAVAVIVGNEANGIRAELLTLADKHISLPMAGRAESLNVSVAAGVLLYETSRQRRQIT